MRHLGGVPCRSYVLQLHDARCLHEFLHRGYITPPEESLYIDETRHISATLEFQSVDRTQLWGLSTSLVSPDPSVRSLLWDGTHLVLPMCSACAPSHPTSPLLLSSIPRVSLLQPEVKSLNHVRLFATSWNTAHGILQARILECR